MSNPKEKEKEYKYERVERVDVDRAGNAQLKDVREDRGNEDPGMNYQDKRPAYLVPDEALARGVVVDSGINTDTASIRSSHSSHKNADTVSSHSARTDIIKDSTSSHGSHRSSVNSHSSKHPQDQRAEEHIAREVTIEQNLPRPVVQQTETYRRYEEHQLEPAVQQTEIIDIVSVPVRRMETSRMEHVSSGFTGTTNKDLHVASPMYAPPIQPHSMLDHSGGTVTEIHASTNVDLSANANAHSMAPEEYELYRHKVEDLARQHEAITAEKAALYRNQVEKDAELIRRTLERQHIRDIEFRTDMVETSVDRQQHEIQLEAEYAMRALELEREAARQALEQAKIDTNIDVRMDSAIGTTVSKGSVTTTSEASKTTFATRV